ncbi:MAG: LCP family protein [Dehalococcoidia bacterium]|nr:LCP family protein [Dehalococcoidia bacterium]
MSSELPPFERSPRPPLPARPAVRRHFNPWLVFGIPLFALLSLYASLVVVSQVVEAHPTLFPVWDSVFGNDLLGNGFVKELPGTFPGKDADQVSINDRINILFLGLDRRVDDPVNTPSRTDSVVVFTLDPYTDTGGAFSIPRDTLVKIPTVDGGYIEDRVNVAYEYGDTWNYPGGGPRLAMDTIERNFGIPIDHYVVLDFINFISLIDRLGGVDIAVPEYAYDPAYTDCNYCGVDYPVEFEPGPEHMDGQRALEYARIRKSDNDFKRIERQQLVMKAVARKASDLGVLLGSNPLKLYGDYKDAVRTDISDFSAGALALLGHKIGPDNIRMVSMAAATYPCTSCTAALLEWNRDKVEELKAQVFSDGRLQGESAVVEVLNGTATPDLAGDFATFLRGQGLGSEQLSVDEYADGELYNSTLIVDLGGKSYTAERLAKWLDLPKGRILSSSDALAAPFRNRTASIVVVLGTDARLPGEDAARLRRVATQIGG